MDSRMPGFSVHHQLLKLAQTHVHELDGMSWSCHPTISSSVVPFSCLQSFPASGFSPVIQFFKSGGQSIRKNSDIEKDWSQEEKGMAEGEMVGWHYWFNLQGFEQAPGDGEGQGYPVCCSPCVCKELDTIEWVKNNNKKFKFYLYFFIISTYCMKRIFKFSYSTKLL